MGRSPEGGHSQEGAGHRAGWSEVGHSLLVGCHMLLPGAHTYAAGMAKSD